MILLHMDVFPKNNTTCGTNLRTGFLLTDSTLIKTHNPLFGFLGGGDTKLHHGLRPQASAPTVHVLQTRFFLDGPTVDWAFFSFFLGAQEETRS